MSGPLGSGRPPRGRGPAVVAAEPGETALLAAAGAALALAGLFWLASSAGASAQARHPVALPLGRLLPAVTRWPGHLTAPLRSWAGAPTGPAATTVFYLSAGVGLAAAVLVARVGSSPAGASGARWARPADLRRLLVGRTAPRGRVVIGRTGRRGRLVATESRQSLLVIGPTQSGKTTGLAVPAILEWQGPVVATSVKDDLVAATLAWRSSRGPCARFDPTSVPGPGWARWSPVAACPDWKAAQKMASWLVESTPGRRGMADAAFWYATAAKQLAPLLLAAERGGRTLADVVRWTNLGDLDEPRFLLETAGESDAATALIASAGRDERIRSSVTTTLETVLAPFEDPAVARATAATDVPVERVLAERGTVYLCGPSHEQQRVAGLFAAFVSTVVDAAVARVAATGGPLNPPLLLVLDEAANIAPIRDLDSLASTGAGLGIQLVTVCQDLAQLSARYDPERARTIANNHRGKLLLSGVGDPGTLDLISGLAGEHRVREVSRTVDRRGGGSSATSYALRRLAPTDELRRVRPGEGVLVYGHLPAARVRLRPWYEERRLAVRAGGSNRGRRRRGAQAGGLRARLGATRGGSPGILG